MTKLLDSEGKLWALMSSKDKAGRIYIRAYRNRWDSVKKRSFVESKVQVGRLLDDGSIRLSKNFVDKFPPKYRHLRRSSKCVWRTNRTNSVRSQRL